MANRRRRRKKNEWKETFFVSSPCINKWDIEDSLNSPKKRDENGEKEKNCRRLTPAAKTMTSDFIFRGSTSSLSVFVWFEWNNFALRWRDFTLFVCFIAWAVTLLALYSLHRCVSDSREDVNGADVECGCSWNLRRSSLFFHRPSHVSLALYLCLPASHPPLPLSLCLYESLFLPWSPRPLASIGSGVAVASLYDVCTSGTHTHTPRQVFLFPRS